MRRATVPRLQKARRDKREAKRRPPRCPSLEAQLDALPLVSRETPSVIFQRMFEPGNVEGFRHLEHSIVSRTLARECEYDRIGRPEQDEQGWKLFKKHNQLRVYKRQRHGVVSDRARVGPKLPHVLCVGSMEGKVEDILYGMHAKTRSEMSAVLTFLGHKPLDCDMLAGLETGTNDDPFRHLSLKYLLAETFRDVRVVNNRDVCALESMGFGVDAQGRRYGYYLLRSVDVPQCTPLPHDSGVVRATVTMCCIYRQVQPRTVTIYSKALVDLGGALPLFMAYNVAKELLLSNAEAIKSATAKRLTTLALERLQARRRTRNPDETNSLTESSLLTWGSRHAFFTYRSTKSVSSMERSYPIESTRVTSEKASIRRCGLCDKLPSMAKIAHATHSQCGVCHMAVCTKCSVKQTLYGRVEPVSVVCCKVCLVAATHLKVDPRDPLPMLP